MIIIESYELQIVSLVSGEQDEQSSIEHLEEELNSWLSRLATFSYQEKDHQALVKEAELIKRELGSQERKRKGELIMYIVHICMTIYNSI
jgi:hypothetical protein